MLRNEGVQFSPACLTVLVIEIINLNQVHLIEIIFTYRGYIVAFIADAYGHDLRIIVADSLHW